MPVTSVSLDLVIDRDLIRKYGGIWPAYISYPAADDFEETFGAAAYETWLQQRRTGGLARPLALYVGTRSSETVAADRLANGVVTADHGQAREYARYLNRELALVADRLKEECEVGRMDWGPAWPAFLGDEGIAELMRTTKSAFTLDPAGDYSIQVDPRAVTEARTAVLAGLGFNRICIGSADLDPAARRATEDGHQVDEIEQAIVGARACGFRSIDVDLVCEPPGQDAENFGKAVDRLIGSSPDRVTVKPNQDAPSLLPTAIDRLEQARYVYIGMGRFARPDDELAQAKQQGRLTYSCCGYSAKGYYYDVIGLGLAALGQVGPTYCQNYATLDAYCGSLARGTLPVMRGIALTRDDLARRSVIESFLCHFEVCLESVSSAFLIDFRKHFSAEISALEHLVAEGVVEIDDDWITATPRGKLVVHAICRVFDRRSQAPESRNTTATPTPRETHRPAH